MTLAPSLVYLRTPLGRGAAFDPGARLSPQLRSMLKAVDGKTSVGALVMQFPDTDATGLLAQLEATGLIKQRGDRGEDAQFPDSALPDVRPVSPSSLPLAPDFAETENAALAALVPLVPLTSPVDAPNVVTSPRAIDSLAAEQNQAMAQEPPTGLALIVDVMSTFVLTHFPQQSFTELGKLEGFKTLEELQAGLPDYAVLVKASGPAGLVHLADLTERMREAAAA